MNSLAGGERDGIVEFGVNLDLAFDDVDELLAMVAHQISNSLALRARMRVMIGIIRF